MDSVPSVIPPTPASDAPNKPNRILEQMLERLFASMVNGPAMNARPHNSRQRIDLTQLSRLQDLSPAAALLALLKEGSVEIDGKTPLPRKSAARVKRGERFAKPADDDPNLSDEDRAQIRAYADQSQTLTKLRTIVEDAKTYEQDTGVAVLNVGFPLLSLPPGTFGGKDGPATRRVLAPIALIPVTVTVKSAATVGVKIACRGDGTDLVQPNEALLAWLQQQTGTKPIDLYADDEGENPWREICDLVKHVCTAVRVAVPPLFDASELPPELDLKPAPRADDDEAGPAVHLSAVAGLYPLANQGLLRDMQAMAEGELLEGPVRSFIYRAETTPPAGPAAGVLDQKLVALADPCQARSVRLARQANALVVHGPPGTGKSQTITNIVGDHLARGQRVLFVCDKRTALDVVQNRLERLGLGDLCAVIHDPQRDQRDLYRAIREQLENLADAKLHPRAEKKLAEIEAELARLHAELTAYHRALSEERGEEAKSFHTLVGEWFAIGQPQVELADKAITLKDVSAATVAITDILRRAVASEYAGNPWREAAGVSLADYLARPMDSVRAAMTAVVDAATKADATRDPAIPPLLADVSLAEQAADRQALADALETALTTVSPDVLRHWSARGDLGPAGRKFAEAAGSLQAFESSQPETELAMVDHARLPTVTEIIQRQNALNEYLAIAGKWYAFVMFGKKSAAKQVLAVYGQPLSAAAAQRVAAYLVALKARVVLSAVLRDVGAATQPILADEDLRRLWHGHQTAIALRAMAKPPLAELLSAAMADPTLAPAFVDGLRKSKPRCDALAKLEAALSAAQLFDARWAKPATAGFRAGGEASPVATQLQQQLPTLEDVLRIRAGFADLSAALKPSVDTLLKAPIDPPAGIDALRKAALANTISARLAADPQLQQIDGKRMAMSFERYRELTGEKAETVVKVINHLWTDKQQSRLLAESRERASSLGADMKRRLTLRGQRAMRLRQVIAVGSRMDGGDPLFDLRPVWMASPETVAQIFDRTPMFDVVIFDEASQCRLEEALPVLTRGRRVVIAGDPQQLPPTRFFESAVATSEDEELETDQDLFEAQQADVEDLLAAALGLDLQESYLDVHYRSRNADLIGFSNQHFYGSRLQAIPGHPDNRAKLPPVTMVRVDGLYEERANEAEADKVVEIVKDLLARPKPPSIGVACFNLVQRDLITEKLDNAASEDADFARKLAAARTRVGSGSFEGLFVKNLENVQGDERDHLIISTTYGPGPNGKFRQNFGPLGKSGGGRRLNVLVTRAREQVHLVTSIPQTAYKALPPVPPGQQATGAYLLYAYLAYADRLSEAYTTDNAAAEAADALLALHRNQTQTPSVFVEALAAHLSRRRSPIDLYWGNDGLGIDVAVRHPAYGILCDTTRFTGTDDPVQWDIFRTGMHESQGWKLLRIWTPHFFRDPSGVLGQITQMSIQQVHEQEAKYTQG